MPNFKIINNTTDTPSGEWNQATKFNSKDRLVDDKGHEVSPGYIGRQYRIIEKRERAFSCLERFGRGLLGMVAVICTLSLGVFSKSIRNLFTKSKANIRFAVLEEQTQFKVESVKVVPPEPKPLFGGTKISENQELNFALIETAGKQKLVPVTSAPFGREYTPYEGSALEALLKIAQDKEPSNFWRGNRHYGSPINHFLKHLNNSLITEEAFLKFILEKDETGTPRICTLNSASTLEALILIKAKKLPINLNETTPTGETLFTLWAGKGNAAITKVMLELDPSVIEQTQGQVNSAFVEAVLNGSKEEADLLIDAMAREGIILSQEELWIQKAFKNDCVFSEEEFTQLPQELKIKVFFSANAFGNEDIVKKLKPLVMNTDLFWPGPSILARNMDIVTTRAVMEAFLKGLRKDGLLLTAEEFSKLDKKTYSRKIDQIGRIQGKNFIEKLVKENDLKHIKVPKKFAVIHEGLKSISFRIAANLELRPTEYQLVIYAEQVKPVYRKLSLEEAIELMIILETTCYSNFYGNNFFLCEDGIYFINTEYKDFWSRAPQFESIKSLKDRVDPKDAEKFLAEYEKRKEAYDKNQDLREAQQKEYCAAFENPYTRLTTGYAEHEFVFPLASLGIVT